MLWACEAIPPEYWDNDKLDLIKKCCIILRIFRDQIKERNKFQNYFNDKCDLLDFRINSDGRESILAKMESFCTDDMEITFRGWMKNNIFRNLLSKGKYPSQPGGFSLENRIANEIIHSPNILVHVIFANFKRFVHHLIQHNAYPTVMRLIFNHQRWIGEDLLCYIRACSLFDIGLRLNTGCSNRKPLE